MNLEEAVAEVGGEVMYRQTDGSPAREQHGWIVGIQGRTVEVRFANAALAVARPEDLRLIAHAPAPTSTLRSNAPSAWTPEMPHTVSSANGFPDDYWEGER